MRYFSAILLFFSISSCASSNIDKAESDNMTTEKTFNLSPGQLRSNIAAANNGDMMAINNLITHYMNNGNTNEAIRWSHEGALKGDCDSMSIWVELLHEAKNNDNAKEIDLLKRRFGCKIFSY